MLKFCLTFASGALLAGSVAAAPLVIDRFDTPQGPLASANGVLVADTIPNDGTFVGNRTIAALGDGTPPPDSQFTTVEIGGGVFEFASGVGVDGQGAFAYSALGGLNLSNYTGFTFEGLSADQVFDFEIELIDTGGNSSIASGTFAQPTPIVDATLFYSFANFVGTADFSMIDQMEFVLGSGPSSALDFSLSGISAAIPVPASGLLLISALSGMAFLRRRRAV